MSDQIYHLEEEITNVLKKVQEIPKELPEIIVNVGDSKKVTSTGATMPNYSADELESLEALPRPNRIPYDSKNFRKPK